MSFADIIDGVFRLMKANFLAVFPWLMLAALPFEVLTAYARYNGPSVSSLLSNFGSVRTGTTMSTTELVLTYAAEVGLWWIMPVAAGVVYRTSAASYLGDQLRAGDAARLGAGQILALIVASLVGHLSEAVGGVLCLLPGIALAAFFFLIGPAIVIEHLGPFAAIGRSWRLVSRRFWPVLGTMLLGIVMAVIITNIISALPEVLAATASSHVSAVVDAVVGTLGSALEWAIVGNLAFMLYLDQRIRQEGFDLEVMARRPR
jgi:hypothetical protein